MRILIGTGHFFAPIYRDAGMHRFARSLAAKGHHVDFITFGQSWLKHATKPETRRYIRSARQAAATGTNPPNIHAHVHRELIHPPSGSAKIERLTRWLVPHYGKQLDTHAVAAAQQADVIILECGYSACWLPAIRTLAPRAKYLAFYNDRLDLVGFRQEIIDRNMGLLPQFGLVRTNAERLLDFLPDGVNGRYIPQGVDKEKLRSDLPSPFAPGTRNIVSVGNMLFDADAIRAIAEADPGAKIHVIGTTMANPPDNVLVHGELPFEVTLPYMVHADVGLAPYRPEEGADYLVQSSLKIQQYSYCGLPILLNAALGINGRNMIHYDLGTPGSVVEAVSDAFAMEKTLAYGSDLLDWSQVGDVLLDVIAQVKPGSPPV